MTPETADIVNTAFILFAAVGAWANVYAYWRDRCVEGVAWPFTIGFGAWGVWNLYYYTLLGQHFSALAEVVIVTGNFVWIAQILYDKFVVSKIDPDYP